MRTRLRTRVVKIGNSRGIRIPKPVLDQLDLGDEVELEVRAEELAIRPARRARQGWEGQFRRMAEHGDDRLLDDVPPGLSEWDDREWTWE
jgi:antitoxin MazE